MFDNEKERLRFKAMKAVVKLAMKEAINEALLGGQPPQEDDDDEPLETQVSEDDVL